MSKENIIQGFRLNDIDQTKNYFVEEIEKNELMSRKYKMFCALDYIRWGYVWGTYILKKKHLNLQSVKLITFLSFFQVL